jgi:hypothetical protein
MVFSGRLKYGILFKVAFRDGPPEVVRKVAGQQFIDQIDGPENVMDDQQNPVMVIMPADHERVQAEEEIDNTGRSAVHS